MSDIVAYCEMTKRGEYTGRIKTIRVEHNGTLAWACSTLGIPEPWAEGETRERAISNFRQYYGEFLEMI